MSEEEKTYLVVRSEGKVYFGALDEDATDERIVLNDVVELVTMMSPTTMGMQKHVAMVSIDYASGPIKKVVFPAEVVAYALKDIPQSDATKFMTDYENLCQGDHIVKAPVGPSIVQPK